MASIDPTEVSDGNTLREMPTALARFCVADYDLSATLESGQSFRWKRQPGGWQGVVGDSVIRVRQRGLWLEAESATPLPDWTWLMTYLGLKDDLAAIVATFPDDPPLREALMTCRGLRLLRQSPWECLVSFICSATKQIAQIQQCVASMAARFGSPLKGFPNDPPEFTFPSAVRLAEASEGELRACKLGFRAPYVRAAAQAVASHSLDLERLDVLSTSSARSALTALPGVGPKIADCVLLFAYGRQDAFPLDVWLLRALAAMYFPKRRPSPRRLRQFADTHFGPWAGYAQQYLFHHARLHRPDLRPARRKAK